MGLAKMPRKLEGSLTQEFGDWPLEDQLQSVAADTCSRTIISQINKGTSDPLTVTWMWDIGA